MDLCLHHAYIYVNKRPFLYASVPWCVKTCGLLFVKIENEITFLCRHNHSGFSRSTLSRIAVYALYDSLSLLMRNTFSN